MRTALFLLLSLTPAAPATQEDFAALVDIAVGETLEATVAWRRDIHEHPELGEREHRTAALVAEQLERLGLEVRTGIGGTGVVGLLRGGRPGGVCAWRADMDALPVTEETGLAYASRVTDEWGGEDVGVMHACGHDVHTAVALGVATVLARKEVRSRLPGSVLFLFQPAEEGHPGPGLHGAARMLAKLCGVDLRPRSFDDLEIAQTIVARLSAIVVRDDIGETLAYHLLADSASALYLWDCVVEAMAEFDGVVAGAEALGEDR